MTDILKVDWAKIPQPEDDGLANHLVGTELPALELMSTHGELVDLSSIGGRVVVYAYPMTAQPDVSLPDGWDMLPGARGCTPQSCAFRDHKDELTQLGVDGLFGLSTQTTEYQKEVVSRLHLSFSLLSDASLQLQDKLKLPVMRVDGMTLLKRLTMIVDDGLIKKVFYPVFPPDENVTEVIQWLKEYSDDQKLD